MLRVVIAGGDLNGIDEIERKIKWDELKLVCIGKSQYLDEALEIALSAKADIVVTTMNLLGGSGLDLTRKLKARNNALEVVAVTEYKKYDEAAELMRLNVVDLLLMPLDSDELDMAMRCASKKIRMSDRADNICRIVSARDVKNDNFIGKAIAYLDKHYKDKISLDSVAKDLYISSWHLCKCFKKYTGKSFVDVVNLIRITKAREFLKNSALKVNEIARRVGYNDIAYFTVLFKKITGYTPLKYRNNPALSIKMDIDRKDDIFRAENLRMAAIVKMENENISREDV